jgi:hypothetical protein
MIFLISYDRRTQSLTQAVEVFADAQRDEAYRRRLEAELELPKEEQRYEVVLLEGPSREAIEVSHARYFFGPHELIESARESLQRATDRRRDNGNGQLKP